MASNVMIAPLGSSLHTECAMRCSSLPGGVASLFCAAVLDTFLWMSLTIVLRPCTSQ